MSETKENLLTLTAIKADVGSIGGHTLPSAEMLELCRTLMGKAQLEQGLIVDWRVTHIGDDICLFMTHREGSDNPAINDLAWNTLFAAAGVAKKQGLYGAGQDLLEDAPSGNVRGAGPGSNRRRDTSERAVRRSSSESLSQPNCIGFGVAGGQYPLGFSSHSCPHIREITFHSAAVR